MYISFLSMNIYEHSSSEKNIRKQRMELLFWLNKTKNAKRGEEVPEDSLWCRVLLF